MEIADPSATGRIGSALTLMACGGLHPQGGDGYVRDLARLAVHGEPILADDRGIVEAGFVRGDVRDSVSGEEGGTPTVAAKHTTEHPPCHSELRRSRVYRWRLRS
jgi:hypothetical protein